MKGLYHIWAPQPSLKSALDTGISYPGSMTLNISFGQLVKDHMFENNCYFYEYNTYLRTSDSEVVISLTFLLPYTDVLNIS